MIDGRRYVPIFALSALVLLLIGVALHVGKDEYDTLMRQRREPLGTQTSLDVKVGPGRIHTNDEIRRRGGLETMALRSAESRVSLPLHGVVADIRSLVDARGRYLTQSAEIRALRASKEALEAEYRRAQALFADDRNVAERVVAQSEADWKNARERLSAAETALKSIVEGLSADWGRPISEMALNSDSKSFTRLLDLREVLVLVTLPMDRNPVQPPRHVVLDVGGKPVHAGLVSPAPAVQPGFPGVTFYYRAAADALRYGARVTGYAEVEGSERGGVTVPESAVVWYAGRPWIYVRDEKEPDVFERVPVDATRLVPGGWFNAGKLEPGVEVVVVGAQLLLSEELEYKIRDENDD